MAQFFRRYFRGRKDLEILDVGCGTGKNLSVLEDFGNVSGIDISEEAEKYCKKRGYEIVNGDVMDIPFPDDKFDVVTSLGLFYHRNVDDDLQGMKEIHRILKPGGRLFFFDSAMHCLSSNHDIVFHGIRRYTRAELTVRLQKTGFRVDRLSYVNAIFFPLAYLKRRFEKFIGLKPRSDIVFINQSFNDFIFILCCIDLYCSSFIEFPFGINIVAHAGKVSEFGGHST